MKYAIQDGGKIETRAITIDDIKTTENTGSSIDTHLENNRQVTGGQGCVKSPELRRIRIA